jgi:hypothetical protein
MEVLVATAATQGATATDRCGTVEGELVRLPISFPGHPAGTDQPKGFVGMSSQAFTTTVKVARRPGLDELVLTTLFEEDWRDRGLALGDDLRRLIGVEVCRLLQVAESFPVGTVLERHGITVRARN